MKIRIIYSLVCFLFIGNLLAQQTPAPKQTQDYSIEYFSTEKGRKCSETAGTQERA